MKKILQTAILLLGVFALQAQSGRPVRETSPNAFINLQQWVMVGKGFYLPKVATPPTQRPSVLNGGVDTVGATVFCLSDNSQYIYTGGDSWITGAILPNQTGHANEYLGTNGTSFSWSFPDYNHLLNLPDLTVYATKTGLHGTSPIVYDPSTGAFHWDFTVANTWTGAQTFNGQIIVGGNSVGTKSSLSNIPFIDNGGNLHTGTAGGRLQWNNADGGLRIGTLVANGTPSVANPSGIYLYDSTITSSGAQGSASPIITLEAQGWATSDAASKQVDMSLQLSTAGGTSPSGILHIKSSIAGGTYGSDVWSLDNIGNEIVKGHITGITESTADSSDRMASTALLKQLLYQAYGVGSITQIGDFATTPINNGAEILSSSLIFHPASETYPGMLSTVAQNIAGLKTLLKAPIISELNINGGLVFTDASGQTMQSQNIKFDPIRQLLNIGGSNIISGSPSLSIIAGIQNRINAGGASIIAGGANNIQCSDCIVAGTDNYALDAGTTILAGAFNRIYSTYAFAIGKNLTGRSTSSGAPLYTLMGQYNDSTLTDVYWGIGTGTDNTHRKTGFYIDSALKEIVLNQYSTISADTTHNKVLVWNDVTKHVKAMYWPATAGGGGDGEPIITAPNTVNRYYNGYKNFVTLNTDSVGEGTLNKYFTNARARGAIVFTAFGNTGLASYTPSTGVLNIPDYSSRVITMTGDVKASAAGTLTDTVIGLLANTLPSLSAGKLSWNGTAWVFDNIVYFKGTDTLSSGPLLTKHQYDTSTTSTVLIHSGNSGVQTLYTSTDGSILYDKKLRGNTGVTVASLTDSSNQISVNTLYTADGTLTADRAVSGAGFGLQVGTSSSKTAFISLYSAGAIGLYGMPILSAFPTITDANYTGSAGQATYKLPAITANRTFTPPSAGGNALLWIWNTNTTGNTWSPVSTNFKDASGATITSFANNTFYAFMNDGTNWISMSGSTGGGSYTADESTLHLSSGVFSIKSTYTGQASIVTVGTIASGSWQGTAIADTYIASASTWNAKAATTSPTFTGTVVLPSTTSIGSITSTELGYVDGVTSAIQTQFTAKAPLASPAFTGTPSLPTGTTGVTQSASDNSTKLSTTAYADAAANSAKLLLFSTAHTANYTLVLSDANSGVQMNVASANTVTIPPNSSVAFPIGTTIVVEQLGAGASTATAGAGVTIHGLNVVTAGQYGTQTYIKKATDEWLIL